MLLRCRCRKVRYRLSAEEKPIPGNLGRFGSAITESNNRTTRLGGWSETAACCFVIAGIGNSHVTCFAAIRTVVESIHAKPDAILRLTETAILRAATGVFGLVALRAHCYGF